MTEIDGIYAIFLLISTLNLYLSFYSWNKRSNPDVLYFSFLMLAVSIWTISSYLKLHQPVFSSRYYVHK